MFRRCDDATEAQETPIGWLPAPGDLDTTGLQMDAEDLDLLLQVDAPEPWAREMPQLEEHYARFGNRLPAELSAQLATLREAARGLSLRHAEGAR